MPQQNQPFFGSNQQAQQAAGQPCQWEDQDMLGDLLAQEKALISDYGMQLCESSCPQMRQMFVTNLDQTSQDQFMVFQKMQQRGWYPTKAAQQQNLQEAKSMTTQMKNKLS